MKKRLLALFGAFLIVTGVSAESLTYSIGDLKLVLPGQNAEVVYLYDIINAQGLGGAETVFVEYKSIQGSFGAISDADFNGTAFLGIRTVITESGNDLFHVGVWVGRDYRDNLYRAGIKASVPLW